MGFLHCSFKGGLVFKKRGMLDQKSIALPMGKESVPAKPIYSLCGIGNHEVFFLCRKAEHKVSLLVCKMENERSVRPSGLYKLVITKTKAPGYKTMAGQKILHIFKGNGVVFLGSSDVVRMGALRGLPEGKPLRDEGFFGKGIIPIPGYQVRKD
jgi:hypothetical protein